MNMLRIRLFGRGKSERAEADVIDLLRRIPMFEDLSKRELAAVERILHRREYLPEEVIFREGEPGMGMYIIHSGRVAIVAEPSNVQLSELKEGDFFGEVSLLDESPRSATAIARTSCKVFGFFQPDLFSLVERNPRLGVKIVIRLAKIIGVRLRNTNEQVLASINELKKLRATSARKKR